MDTPINTFEYVSLGTLKLLSLILYSLGSTIPIAKAKRRNPKDPEDKPDLSVKAFKQELDDDGIADIVMPVLNAYSDNIKQVNERGFKKALPCLLNAICTVNTGLAVEFGDRGRRVGRMLGRVMENLARKRLRYPISDNEVVLRIDYAGRAGRNLRNCWSFYPPCL